MDNLRALLFCCLVVVSNLSHAGAALAIPYSLTRIVNAVDGSFVANYQFRDAANAGRYLSAPVNYSKGRMGSLLKGRIVNPGALAVQASIAAAVAGVGWFIDEATRQVMHVTNGTVSTGQCSGPYPFVTVNEISQNQCGALAEAHASERGWTYDSGWYTSPINPAFQSRKMGTSEANSLEFGWGAGSGTTEETQVTEVSDEDLAGAIAANAPGLLPYALTDPLTGEPLSTPETEAKGAELSGNLDAMYDTDPLNDPAPGTVPDVATQPTPEVPVFCEWAGPLCDWLDWTKEPATDESPPVIPTTTVGTYQPYDTGLGAGSCPQAPTFELFGQTYDIPIQPACDLMGMLAPIVIGVAYLVAGLLIVRV